MTTNDEDRQPRPELDHHIINSLRRTLNSAMLILASGIHDRMHAKASGEEARGTSRNTVAGGFLGVVIAVLLVRDPAIAQLIQVGLTNSGP